MAIRNRQSYKKYEEISPIGQVSLVCKYKKTQTPRVVHLSIYKIIIKVMTIYITALYNILISFFHGNSQLVGALSMYITKLIKTLCLFFQSIF